MSISRIGIVSIATLLESGHTAPGRNMCRGAIRLKMINFELPGLSESYLKWTRFHCSYVG